ncbi:hypothetical protein M885DRAFT_624845 [Pelagophyceae sp. CCMP2097]|nr:hypothetical protein M885DRAFT_624845 [Pelagophyceae sp. CCMP2097]
MAKHMTTANPFGRPSTAELYGVAEPPPRQQRSLVECPKWSAQYQEKALPAIGAVRRRRVTQPRAQKNARRRLGDGDANAHRGVPRASPLGGKAAAQLRPLADAPLAADGTDWEATDAALAALLSGRPSGGPPPQTKALPLAGRGRLPSGALAGGSQTERRFRELRGGAAGGALGSLSAVPKAGAAQPVAVQSASAPQLLERAAHVYDRHGRAPRRRQPAHPKAAAERDYWEKVQAQRAAAGRAKSLSFSFPLPAAAAENADDELAPFAVAARASPRGVEPPRRKSVGFKPGFGPEEWPAPRAGADNEARPRGGAEESKHGEPALRKEAPQRKGVGFHQIAAPPQKSVGFAGVGFAGAPAGPRLGAPPPHGGVDAFAAPRRGSLTKKATPLPARVPVPFDDSLDMADEFARSGFANELESDRAPYDALAYPVDMGNQDVVESASEWGWASRVGSPATAVRPAPAARAPVEAQRADAPDPQHISWGAGAAQAPHLADAVRSASDDFDDNDDDDDDMWWPEPAQPLDAHAEAHDGDDDGDDGPDDHYDDDYDAPDCPGAAADGAAPLPSPLHAAAESPLAGAERGPVERDRAPTPPPPPSPPPGLAEIEGLRDAFNDHDTFVVALDAERDAQRRQLADRLAAFDVGVH